METGPRVKCWRDGIGLVCAVENKRGTRNATSVHLMDLVPDRRSESVRSLAGRGRSRRTQCNLVSDQAVR